MSVINFLMDRVNFVCLVLCVIVCKIQGETLNIKSKFINGDILFTWTGDTSQQYNVRIIRDTKTENIGWSYYNQTTYTVTNALLYDSVAFSVGASGAITERVDFKVSKIEGKVRDSVNISWTAPFFPGAGLYNIYHTNIQNISIIQVSGNGSVPTQSKYKYTSRPYNSLNISFSITDITLRDAGYYAGGVNEDSAWSGGGVVLIVLEKPSKPKINGRLNVLVGLNLKLTCSSTSKSAPDYYAKLVNLSYTWFVNGTKQKRENRETLTFQVKKTHRNSEYSCTASEGSLESEHSDSVKINPLYKPDTLTITPQPPANDRLTVKEGETIGPYNCSADCNPPCVITWKRKDTDGNVTDALPVGRQELRKQTVYRNMSLFRCVAKYDENNKMKYNISLDIQYLDKPKVFINEVRDPSRKIEKRESETLSLSCFVDSNPDPNIVIAKNSKETSMIHKDKAKWLNHTFESLQCSESGTYTCTGVSTGFNSTKTTSFDLNVTCKTRVDETTIKSIYASRSGHDVKVSVAVPVIANPPPQESNITWTGPTGDLPIKSTVSQQDISYKHWINSSIPITDQNYFGNFTLKYNGDEISILTIIAEDVPQKPLNFTGYSYTIGYINLTWVSGFNGGQQQHFILSKKEDSEWREVANVSDPGEGRLVHFDPRRLNIGREYMFRLKSCNAINCSKESVDIKISVKEEHKQNILLDKKFVVGASGAIIIFILTIALLLYCLKKRTTKKRQRNIQVEVEDDDQPDVVLYAAVDKSAVKNNQSKADVVEDIPEKTNGNETLYATVEKGSKAEPNTIPDKKTEEEKKESTNKKREGVTSAKASENTASSNVNQDGLIYIDVEFAKKPDNVDKNAKPKIHGEKDRTEYTFVDFSKRAPVVKEKPKKEEGK